MVWLTGFFFAPELPLQHHAVVAAVRTQQTLLFGNLQYRFGRALERSASAFGPNLTARSM